MSNLKKKDIKTLERLPLEEMEQVVGGSGPVGTTATVMVSGNHNSAAVLFNGINQS